jgi:hypothetical protein
VTVRKGPGQFEPVGAKNLIRAVDQELPLWST